MILYFSGTGNSAYVAETIAGEIGDMAVNLFDKIRSHDITPLESQKTWVVVTPTYAWRIPRILQEWLEKTELKGSRDIMFAMTCGADIGNAGKYLKELSAAKGMNYLGCQEIVMPENYIAMFKTPSADEARRIIQKAQAAIEELMKALQTGAPLPERKISLTDRITSGPVNKIFYSMFVHAKKFYATDQCISCGLCAQVCPMKNVALEEGKPVWGSDCTHCMACICRCPKEAIEYGKHSVGLPRYYLPKILPAAKTNNAK